MPPSGKKVRIELHYLPCLQFFSKFFLYQQVLIEAHEHYAKRSYRNRCHIGGANGPLRLSIPLQQGKNEQQPIREVRIAQGHNWQHQHWQSIQSAYGKTPFFEHYAPELQPFFQREWTFLFDLNLELLHWALDTLGLPPHALSFTERYLPDPPAQIQDLHDRINPRSKAGEDPCFNSRPYVQPFREKFGFLPNLSILDLLFCTGPEAPLILQASAKRK